MARGVFALGKTQDETERPVRDGAPQMRILRSRRISLAGLPPLPASGPLENPWVVVSSTPIQQRRRTFRRTRIPSARWSEARASCT